MFDSLRGQPQSRAGANQRGGGVHRLPPSVQSEPVYLDDDDGADYDDEDDDGEDDEDDVGTVHPYGPNVDPHVLLSTLTHTNGAGAEAADAAGLLPEGSDFNSDFKRTLFSNVARNRTANADRGVVSSGEQQPRPGPPRDLVAQVVNPRFVALTWLEPATHPDEVTSYTVFYKMTTSER